MPPTAGIEAALPQLERRAQDRPADSRALEAYGVALQSLDRTREALPFLRRAAAIDPSRASAIAALARVRLADGDLAGADSLLDAARPRGRQDEALLRSARIETERARLAREMRERLAEERRIDAADLPQRSLAVHEFSPSSGVGPELMPLGKALAAVVTTELSRIPDLRLVERRRLQVLLEEIESSGGGEAGSPAPPAEALEPATSTLGTQQRLAHLPNASGGPYYAGETDGIAGPKTRAAVEAFQREHGLAADGFVGPRTAAALERAYEEAGAAGRLLAGGSHPGRQTERAGANESTGAADSADAAESVDAVDPADDRAGAPVFPGASDPSVAPDRTDSAPRAGRILGARRILGGVFDTPGDAAIALRGRLIDTVDGTEVAEVEAEEPIDTFYRLPGVLVLRTCEALDIDLAPEQRRRLENLPPATRSMAAFLAFGRGLDLEERGRLDDAEAAYAEALRLDRGFELARTQAEVLPLSSAAFGRAVLQSVRSALRASARGTLDRAIGGVGTGTMGEAPDDSGDPSRSVQADGVPTGLARVRGQIPVGGAP